jgi:hypothetical protein
VIFERIIGGNLSLILTQNLENGTLNPEYNINNDTRINIETELEPALVNLSKSFFAAASKAVSPSSTATAAGLI